MEIVERWKVLCKTGIEAIRTHSESYERAFDKAIEKLEELVRKYGSRNKSNSWGWDF